MKRTGSGWFANSRSSGTRSSSSPHPNPHRRLSPDRIFTPAKLKGYAGIHLKGTGFPWQDNANTYIAGHRIGYLGTDSFLAFYDQDKLKKGDEIFVEDSEGTKYTYQVYKSFVVDPADVWVTKPVPGKSVLTLQTCTFPDYSQRIITRAELVDVS